MIKPTKVGFFINRITGENMPKKFGIAITNPSALYTVGHIGGTADNFATANAHVSGASDLTLNDGALVKNIGPLEMRVAFSGATHASNTGFVLKANEQIFVEARSLDSITVKNNSSGQGITFSIYAN